MTTAEERETIWTHPPLVLGAIGAAIVLLAALYWDGLANLAEVWLDPNREEYSHGILIPAISLFLLWQLKNRFASTPYTGSWLALTLVAVGVALLVLGEFATIYIIVQYGFLIALTGVAWSLLGNRGFVWMIVPLIYLAFMVPLPQFIFQALSAKMQLISSELGVAVIRAVDITVFLEGNVISLPHEDAPDGIYQLQVVEACSGLNYLFPLASFAFLAAYLYKAAMWKRVILFLSSIPITILMNSLRIGIIGVLVENYGIEQAEGFLHMFEGWVIFMTCVAILLAEIWLLNKIGPGNESFREVFGIDFPDPTPADAPRNPRTVPKPFYAAIAILALGLVWMSFSTQRPQMHPEREPLTSFPLQLDEWRGEPQTLEQRIINVLQFTDYYMASFRAPDDPSLVQVYAAYYKEQRTKGNAAHSPRSCIPGGGWEITSLERHMIDVDDRVEPLEVNRLQIEKGRSKQLVYYYFKQRERELSSEYEVKWYLFWDALTRNRSDGALVRFATAVDPNSPDWSAADERLRSVAGKTIRLLEQYVPD